MTIRALSCATAFVLGLVPGFSEMIPSSSPVTIVYRFEGPVPEPVLREMKDATQVLLEHSSLRLEWRNRAEITSSDRLEKLIVVTFLGLCGAGPGDSAGNDDQPLGRARVVDGVVLPFVEIECGRVQTLLRAASWQRVHDPDLVLGRALARVLAHELYHVMARTTSHSRGGVAKPVLTGNDLVSSSLALAPADIDRMRFPQQPPLPAHLARPGLAFVP